MSALTPDEIERFRTDGCLVVDAGIPDDVLDGVAHDVAGAPGDGAIVDGWRASEATHRAAVWPRLMGILRELYGRDPLPFRTQAERTATRRPPRSDALLYGSCPHGYATAVWLALEDVAPKRGPLVVYPGSHTLPIFSMSDAGARPTEDDLPKYERFIRRMRWRYRPRKLRATLRKGQAMLMSANLMYAIERPRDRSGTRFSLLTHVHYEGCRYYRPMTSKGLKVDWREPDFIPLEVPAER